jgi:hypothetical protein
MQMLQKRILLLIPSVFFCSGLYADPIAHTPPQTGDPIRMLANFQTTSGAIVGFEIYWDGSRWMGEAGGEDFPISKLPDADDKRFTFFVTECLCE